MILHYIVLYGNKVFDAINFLATHAFLVAVFLPIVKVGLILKALFGIEAIPNGQNHNKAPYPLN